MKQNMNWWIIFKEWCQFRSPPRALTQEEQAKEAIHKLRVWASVDNDPIVIGPITAELLWKQLIK